MCPSDRRGTLATEIRNNCSRNQRDRTRRSRLKSYGVLDGKMHTPKWIDEASDSLDRLLLSQKEFTGQVCRRSSTADPIETLATVPAAMDRGSALDGKRDSTRFLTTEGAEVAAFEWSWSWARGKSCGSRQGGREKERGCADMWGSRRRRNGATGRRSDSGGVISIGACTLIELEMVVVV